MMGGSNPYIMKDSQNIFLVLFIKCQKNVTNEHYSVANLLLLNLNCGQRSNATWF